MILLLKFRQNYSNLKYHVLKKFTHDVVFKNGCTISELKDKMELVSGVEIKYNPCGFLNSKYDNSFYKKYYPTSQDQLPARYVKDSFLYSFIPLSSSRYLQDKYASITGKVRFGRLMEDADLFAVAVLYKHLQNPHLPKNVPTPYKAVTRMVFATTTTEFNSLPDKDIKITGHLRYVGKSSVIVFVWLEQLDDKNEWNKLLDGSFLLALRENDFKAAAFANALKAFDSRENKVLEEGKRQFEALKKWKEQSLTKRLPTPDEQIIIHNLFMETCGHGFCRQDYLPQGKMWMRDSTRSNMILSLPEDRNLHNTVFGGFLIRHAIELATCLCKLYGSYDSKLIGMNKIDFKKPICVGAIIEMHATVVYTYKEYMQITVSADSVHKVNKDYTTNLFYLTFKLLDYGDLFQVVPYTYQESLMFIDGLRHFNAVMQKINY